MTDSSDAAVVITTYNHARFLGEAIDSVLSQTVAPAEIVVVDDGSTDDPETVTAKYPSVHLIRQDNRGLAAARNTGWRATSSPFVAFLDADDWLRPTAIEVGCRQLAAHPDAAFNYGAYANRYWPSGRIAEVPFRPVPRESFGAMLHLNPIGMHATVLYRRSALEAANGFAEELRACEDYDLYLRLAADRPVACCRDVLADYRQHDSNMSRDPAFMLRAALRVMRRIAPTAQARGKTRDWQASIEEWKAHYVDQWISQLKDTGLNVRALRQLASLATLAPAYLLGKGARRLGRR
ncbi:glycosyltransferase [Sphingomonas sp.]|uniref:glycosyltransferase family 2 protein n=1 Tax=Sphingomonas sp. TaxID=28214 RepID=UPI0025EC8850|nr:glycosyltransferase [Sphingomonas sp.]MBV9526809.1 glycosyltransferase [Sphingomonas sp.]